MENFMVYLFLGFLVPYLLLDVVVHHTGWCPTLSQRIKDFSTNSLVKYTLMTIYFGGAALLGQHLWGT